MIRLAPRHLYACAALGLLASVAYVDRDLGAVPDYLNLVRGYRFDEVPEPTPVEVAPVTFSPELVSVLDLRDALEVCEAARQRYRDGIHAGLGGAVSPDFLEQVVRTPRPRVVGDYEVLRNVHWPAYSAALQELSERALEVRRTDPDNGLYEAVAGLAQLERAVWPPSGGPLGEAFEHEELIPVTRVRDAAAQRRGLELLRRAVRRGYLGAHDSVFVELLSERVHATPIRQLYGRIRASAQPDRSEELFLWQQGMTLLRLNAATPAADRRPLLELTRRLGLRMGTGGEATFPLLVGGYFVQEADQLWSEDSASETSAAAAAERAMLVGLEGERTLPVEADEPLGLLDRMVVRNGVRGPGYDPALNRDFDSALLRSLALWGLLLVAVGGLLRGAWAARRPTTGWSASFQLGEGLRVVAPSFGLAALLVLSAPTLSSEPSTLAAIGSLLLGAGFSASWLLRRAVRQRFELPVQRWTPLVLVGLGAALAWFVVEPRVQLGAGALQLLGLGVAWFGRDRSAAPGLAAFRGRVAVACMSVVIAALSVAEIAFVVPKRDALAAGLESYYVDTVRDGRASWRGGEVLAVFEELERTSPARPH